MSNFHTFSEKEIFEKFNTNKNGLSSEKVFSAREKFGKNEIPEADKISVFGMFFKQFKSLLVGVLFLAAIISLFTGHQIDAVVIFAIIIINAIIGFSQEYKAEQAIASLKKMIIPAAKVVRDGEIQKVNATELVPGDIIVVEEGDNIPADAYLIESSNLRCIEASLTGESVPVEKALGKLSKETSLGDRKNMILKSTFVAGGAGRAVVVATGLNTAIGQIAETLGTIKNEPTNFQKKTKVLARQMAIFAITLSTILFLVAYFFRDYEFTEVLMVTIATLVSAIPEGLPAILSIVLAIGANRMVNKNAIVREFTATETLGAITTIISDKTGTITQNALLVEKAYVPFYKEFSVSGKGYEPKGQFFEKDKELSLDYENIQLKDFLYIAAFSNNSELKFKEENNQWDIIGDPTEAALLALSKKAGIKNLASENLTKIDDLPFSSDIKMRATLVKYPNGKKKILIVGAPEQVLESSSFIVEKEKTNLSKTTKDELSSKIADWSEQAMRVIGLAWIETDEDKIDKEALIDFVFAGFVGMVDPPRADVKKAIAACKVAGIRVIMATGDHVKTAAAIGKQVGISSEEDENSKYPIALSEKELLELSDEEFEEMVQHVNIFARLTPNMKLRIAETLQNKGELIAMTGDGVNDAPALKKADVGVAMGIMGTDVARDASQIVLADDNFATIVNAIEEGRIVFTNSRQASFFLITTNFAEVFTIIVCVGIGLPIPLTATQILWLNLVTDGASGLALATEQGHGEVLEQKPVNKDENILNKEVFPFLIINATIMMVLSIAAFKYFLPEGEPNLFQEQKARTAVFVVLAFTQLFNALNMRSLTLSVFKIGLFSNKYINIALIVSVILQISIIEIPFLKEIFRLQRLEISELIVLVSLSSLVLFFGEIYKFVYKRIVK